MKVSASKCTLLYIPSTTSKSFCLTTRHVKDPRFKQRISTSTNIRVRKKTQKVMTSASSLSERPLDRAIRVRKQRPALVPFNPGPKARGAEPQLSKQVSSRIALISRCTESQQVNKAGVRRTETKMTYQRAAHSHNTTVMSGPTGELDCLA